MTELRKEQQREQQASAGRRAQTLLKEISPYLRAIQTEVMESMAAGPLPAWELSCLQARLLDIRALSDLLKRDINAGKIAERRED